MNILSIETSCDETAIAIVKSENNKTEILANIVSSQIELHAKWGGVVPNLAAREHTKNILPVLKEALEKAEMIKDGIDLISVTQGPGLIPALLVGVTTAKSLAHAWQKPLLGIHHIEGHIYANWTENTEIKFPALALVVSGGHTQLVLMKDHLQYKIVGETQDDAVGEAYDKVARMLGLGYPGGPIIDKKAEKFENEKNSEFDDIKLPRPMLNSQDYNFSFSGLKTASLYAVKMFREKNNLSEKDALPKNFINKIAHEFQSAATEVLIKKTVKAAQEFSVKSVILAGGVSANKKLRSDLKKAINEELFGIDFTVPPLTYCLDNATMIALATTHRWKKMSKIEKEKSLENYKTLQADSGLQLK
ncbi:MAG: tRNA (adenosine(37)-N6)-threonylcarbamoyltransferase complex transferase subunit TsaD [Candidatus Moranbacteria bacterium]|nr:tRNA (adenosine(37)-N6)-threonylcarbamoyltransferase complex transferase subunit TsaD [Candidatus Moranbacteria bacterium]